ncbi:MAG TPA: BamA/TamA family outer membrane protein [Flavisolibacter sp.]|nr:BamA/TamA family outer membrane protein [Flavisolibacter sp.]
MLKHLPLIKQRSGSLTSALIALLLSATAVAQTIVNDSITIAIAPEYDRVSGMHRALFGESYRKLWAAPVTLRVVHLSREKGGLAIVKEGGGLQTKSIRLQDASGKEWVLRSVQKYPERGLPPNLRATIVKDILQDQVVTSHPYAALTIPPLAEALNIPHAHPEIVYVADDTALGDYRKDFANTVLMLEEREPIEKSDNTEKAQRKAEEDNDNRFDQRKVLRARLLDLFIGDWDRHEDQWRWAETDSAGVAYYQPIPKDRDKAYYTTSGLFPWALSHQHGKANLQPFRPSTRKINSYNYNNRYFDRYMLTGLPWSVWEEEVAQVQQLLTDSLIRSSIRLLPEPIYRLSGDFLTRTLLERRSHLPEMAQTYYKALARFVDVPGSDKQELFDLEYLDNGQVQVNAYKLKKDRTTDQLLYSRTFDPGVTKEIRLYGLGGEDSFHLKGSSHSSIKVHLVGGADNDRFVVDPSLHNRHRIFVYDRSDSANGFPDGRLARIRESDDSLVNAYNRRNFQYEKFRPVYALSFNPDQGLVIGVGVLMLREAFRKEPYAQRHLLRANYATGWKSLHIAYDGDFHKIWGKNNLAINLDSKGPNYIHNFFGLGNETVFDQSDEKGLLYYRNYYNTISGDVRLYRQFGKSLVGSIGPTFNYYNSSSFKNRYRYLALYEGANPKEAVFESRMYGGGVARLEANTISEEDILPNKGIYWNLEGRMLRPFEAPEGYHHFTQLQSSFTFYIPIGDSSVVLANRIGGGTTWGEAPFYQQYTLGGVGNLRGYNINRFTGASMAYHNIELRVRLFRFTSYLFPGSFGIMAFNDVGRVWTPGESSGTWHNGYGGGIFITPAEKLLIQFSAAKSVEGTQAYFSAGFAF